MTPWKVGTPMTSGVVGLNSPRVRSLGVKVHRWSPVHRVTSHLKAEEACCVAAVRVHPHRSSKVEEALRWNGVVAEVGVAAYLRLRYWEDPEIKNEIWILFILNLLESSLEFLEGVQIL